MILYGSRILDTMYTVEGRAVPVLSNPVQLCTMCLAILSVFVDPTTAGIGDSKTALGYDKPHREE